MLGALGAGGGETVVAGLGELTADAAPGFEGDARTRLFEVDTTAACVVTARFGVALTLRLSVGRGAIALSAGRLPPDLLSTA